jgi:hypothetical protein
MKKSEVNQVISEIKERGGRRRGPVTLSLNGETWERFKDYCEAKGVKPSQLIEELIKKVMGD